LNFKWVFFCFLSFLPNSFFLDRHLSSQPLFSQKITKKQTIAKVLKFGNKHYLHTLYEIWLPSFSNVIIVSLLQPCTYVLYFTPVSRRWALLRYFFILYIFCPMILYPKHQRNQLFLLAYRLATLFITFSTLKCIAPPLYLQLVLSESKFPPFKFISFILRIKFC